MTESINLSTLGVQFGYAVEATIGTRPTSDFKFISEVTSIPSLNPTPESLDCTTLAETEYKVYIDGLKDIGGALTIGANLTQSLLEKWDTLMAEYKTAKIAGKRVWWAVVVPGLDKAVMFAGNPAAQGLPAIEVNGVLQTEIFVTPTNAPGWYDKPTLT